jgi:hypothetical protein
VRQVGKSLVRILKNPREIQYVVLLNIATMAAKRPVRVPSDNNIEPSFLGI